MTTIAFVGDWHGAFPQATARLMALGERGITRVISAGDFGLWPGASGKRFLLGIDKVAARYGVERIDVVPGNHEDWGRLSQLWANPKHRAEDGRLLPVQVSDTVTFLPRGHRWEIEGRTLVGLGGAPSVDFEYRTANRDWWPGEVLEAADVARTVAGGHAEVMVTHDAPGAPYATAKVARILADNPLGWSERALAYARVGRELVTEAVLGVRPKLLVHGHHHVADETTVRLPGADHDTRIWSLASGESAGNARLLDLETLDEPRRPHAPR